MSDPPMRADNGKRFSSVHWLTMGFGGRIPPSPQPASRVEYPLQKFPKFGIFSEKPVGRSEALPVSPLFLPCSALQAHSHEKS